MADGDDDGGRTMSGANLSHPASASEARVNVRRLASVSLGQVPAALLLLAEAFWIAILYTLMQVARSEPQTLGPVAFALAAAAGGVAVRRGAGLGERWPPAATVLVGLAAATGWLLAPAAREALLSPNPGAALSTHPGGWLLGLAFMRGVSVGGARDSAPTQSLVMAGVPVIAVAYAIAAAMGGARLEAFAASAVPYTVLFVAAGLVGMALVRIRWLGAVSSVRWSVNRAWLALLLALVAGMLLVTVPVSFVVAPLVMLIIALLPVPLFIAGLIVGIDRRLLQTLVMTGVFMVFALAIVRALLDRRLQFGQSGSGGNPLTATTPDNAWFAVAGWLVLVAAVALAVAIILLLWMRPSPARLEDAGEERTIDRSPERVIPADTRVGRHPRRGGTPRDAVEAYLAALGLLASHDDLRRFEGETPAEHVHRLRSMESPEPPSIARPLAMLAADFELFEFAGRPLSASEHRRGLARWESIRSALRKRPGTRRLL